MPLTMRATRSRTLAARQLIGKKVQIYTKRLCVEYGDWKEPENCQYYEIHRKGYSTGWKIVSAAIWQHDTEWHLDLEGSFNGQYYYLQARDRHIIDYLPSFPAGILIDQDSFEYGYNHMFNCDITTQNDLWNHLDKLHHEEVEEDEDYYNETYGDDSGWDQLKLSNQRQKDILDNQEKRFQAAGKPPDMEWREWWYGISKGVGGGSGAGTFQK